MGVNSRRKLSIRTAAALALAMALCGFVLLAPGGGTAAELEFPALTGRVVDQAGLLTSEEEASLGADLEALEKKSTDQLVVVTLRSLQGHAIEDFGYRLGRHWSIGQKGKDNGVLLIVAPSERKVRIEVGRGLEPVLTDAISKLIIEISIVPRFKQGDVSGGIKAGVRDIIDVLTGDVETVKLRAQSREDDDSGMVAIIIMLIWLVIVLVVVWGAFQSAGKGAKGKSSGWTSGSSSSSGSGWSGGGFSGGGGGFGGGGSSGSW